MSAREVNGRFALSVLWPGEEGEAWTVSVPVSQIGRGVDAFLTFADPTGHLSVSGTIDAVEDWAAALIQETLLIRLRLMESQDQETEPRRPTDE